MHKMRHKTLLFITIIYLVVPILAPHACADDVIKLSPRKVWKQPEKRKSDQYKVSALVLDLDGDGIELTDIDKDAVYWNGNLDDFAEACAWVKPDDGFLAIDLDKNGLIKSSRELFGTELEDGFSKLSLYDSNKDGFIDSQDLVWKQLLIWRDKDTDGYSFSNELQSLEYYKILRIELNYETNDITVSKNKITRSSSYLYDRDPGGGKRSIANTQILCEKMNSIYVGNYKLNSDAFQLPDLRGYGTIPSLYIAMSADNKDTGNLLSLVGKLTAKNFEEIFAPDMDLDKDFSEIMYRWARVENVAPDSRGPNIDARKLAYVEKLTANNFWQHGIGGTPNPSFWAGYNIKQAFSDLLLYQQALFVMQGPAGQIFTGNHYYDPRRDNLGGVKGLNKEKLNYLLKISSSLPTQRREQYWRKIIQLIDNSVGIENLPVEEQSKLEEVVNSSGLDHSFQEILSLLKFVEPMELSGPHSGASLVKEETIRRGDPNKIFHEARKNSQEDRIVLNGVMTELMKSCCSKEEDIVKFLKKHGYMVFDITAAQNQKKNFGVDKLYSKILLGHRRVSFLDTVKKTLALPYNSYDMIIYLRDDSLDWVYATVQIKRLPAKPR